MIDRKQLLDDLNRFLEITLEDDLLERSNSDEVRAALTAEFETAKQAERTALNYEDWRSAYITQMAAAWVLTCVFTRFIEDNQLVASPMIAGPGDRLEHARNDHQVYFTNHPTETDREYLIHVFDTLRDLGGGAVQDVFGPHNVLRQLPNWLSGDAAADLLEFFRKIDPNTGQIVHDFTDPDWDTRFLGDLYQDLSEAARKKYALLQTPDFVEEFILDRTLDPALDEFGLTPETNPEHRFKMIDPACGSGHFLLGSFPRILKRWQEKEPGTNKRDLVQRTLDSIHGVDINPFAVAIARFRLLLVSLQASGITRLADAPAFAMNLACGDSLYHGVAKQQTMDFTDEAHYFKTEDGEELRRILQEGTFHAVVANPPYITAKDKAANKAYRRLHSTCYRNYSLSVPFIERVFNLCIRANTADLFDRSAGHSGVFTANSFMKREFGKKLIEEFLGTVDLTHVVDLSGAFIPGAGTPKLIIFGKNQEPDTPTVRCAKGIQSEPAIPEFPQKGKVWSSICALIDVESGQNEFVRVSDSNRGQLLRHPWSLMGNEVGVELREALNGVAQSQLSDESETIGRGILMLEHSIYIHHTTNGWQRMGISRNATRPFVRGEAVKDWSTETEMSCIFPYDQNINYVEILSARRHFWRYRRLLSTRICFGKTKHERGMAWEEYAGISKPKLIPSSSIIYNQMSTHNHFANNNGRLVCSPSAPMVKIKQHRKSKAFASLLNSSVICFWMKQISRTGIITPEAWENFFEFKSDRLRAVPIPSELPRHNIDAILRSVAKVKALAPRRLLQTRGSQPLNKTLVDNRLELILEKANLTRLQEDSDWECYQLYGLLEDNLTYPTEPSLGIQLGERAFEIVLARKMEAGDLTTTWFEQHGSTPITEIPTHWPDDYKQLVQRRIDVIESNKNIALIEQPEYKRRWNTTPWEEQVEKALKSWLLDRLESYLDFDGRMLSESQSRGDAEEETEEEKPTKHKLYGTLGNGELPRLVSVAQLADVAAQDKQFMEAAEVYKDDPAFDIQRLVEDLVKPEHVPLLPILRYDLAGLRKRAEWEKTWDLQRLEDAARAGTSMSDPSVARLIERCQIGSETIQQIEAWQQRTPEVEQPDTTLPSARELDEILSIPVPRRYRRGNMIDNTGDANYWKLRGELDVPKERWISFPHCEGTDATLMLAWAGYDHLQVAHAISGHYIDVRDNIGGSDDPRLVPLLAGIMELLPWLHQWHSEIDPVFDMRMNEYYETFVATGAADAGLSREDIAAWEPPAKVRKKKATKKKPKEKQQELDV